MPLCKKQSKLYPIFIASLLSVFFFLLIVNTKLPVKNDNKYDIIILRDLISWGLKRQTTHATLTFSILVSLFSILRLYKEKLENKEIMGIYVFFLIFLSYEYYKLLRSFQIVAFWETELIRHSEYYSYMFKQDILQNLFLGPGIYQFFFQTIGLFLIIYIASRMYILAIKNARMQS